MSLTKTTHGLDERAAEGDMLSDMSGNRVSEDARGVTWRCGPFLSITLSLLLSVMLGGCNLLAGSDQSSPETKGTPEAQEAQADGTQNTRQESAQSASPRASDQTSQRAQKAQPPATPRDPSEIPLSMPGDPEFVAIVNGAEITLQQFEEAFGQQTFRLRQRRQTLSPDKLSRLRRSSLQKLIDQKLYIQHMAKRGVSLSDEERANAFKAYRDRFRNPKTFKSFLERNGQTEAQLRASLEFDALVEKGLRDQFASTIQVKEDDVRAFYDQNVNARFTKEAQARVSHLLVAAPVSAGKRTIQKQKRVANKLYRKAKRFNLKQFSELARERSDDLKTRAQGGDLNYFKREGLPLISKEFEEAAAKLKVGEVSEPVKTHLGYHLIRLTRRQKPQVRVSHILLDKSVAPEKIKEIKRRAKTEPFGSLVKEFSIDDRTRLRQGELGFIHHERKHRYGDAFKEACLKGQKGELIGPVESQRGKHLVFITGRRAERLAASHILIRSPKRAKRSQRRAALKKIRAIHEELKNALGKPGNLFVRLAMKHSEDPTRVRGGDLGSFYLGGNPKVSQSFEEASFKGKVGKVMRPVLSPYGWHIIFVQDQQAKIVKPFEEVKREIELELLSQHLRRVKFRLIKQLRDEGKIERFLKP